jgi:hypothetical protein
LKSKHKVEAKKRAGLISSFRLTSLTVRTLINYWRPLGAIVSIYLALNLILASGLSIISSTASDLSGTLDLSSGGKISNALHGFGTVLGSYSSSNPEANSLMQVILLIIESLVIIWALRHLLAEKTVGVKEAYYNALTPFIPFVLVALCIILQLLPMVIGSYLTGILVGVAVGNGLIIFLFILLFLGLSIWSLYMLTSSIFALYIVTLPGVHPRQALLSAKNLVRFRRWTILRRVVFLPLVIVLLMAIIMIPLILFVPVLVAPVFYVLGIGAVLFAHTYLYTLYRSLIHE